MTTRINLSEGLKKYYPKLYETFAETNKNLRRGTREQKMKILERLQDVTIAVQENEQANLELQLFLQNCINSELDLILACKKTLRMKCDEVDINTRENALYHLGFAEAALIRWRHELKGIKVEFPLEKKKVIEALIIYTRHHFKEIMKKA